MSFPANRINAASPASSLSGGRLLSNSTAKHPPHHPDPCRCVVTSCDLLFLVAVIDPIRTSVTEWHNNLPMPRWIQSKTASWGFPQPIILHLTCESNKSAGKLTFSEVKWWYLKI